MRLDFLMAMLTNKNPVTTPRRKDSYNEDTKQMHIASLLSAGKMNDSNSSKKRLTIAKRLSG